MDFHDMNNFMPKTYDISTAELHHNINETLKIWKKLTYVNHTVKYNDSEFNAGTLACMALNIVNQDEDFDSVYELAVEMTEAALCARCHKDDTNPEEIQELWDYAAQTLMMFWESEPFAYIDADRIRTICESVICDSVSETDGESSLRFNDKLFSLVWNACDIVIGIKDLYDAVDRFNDSLTICGLNSSKANLAKIFDKIYKDYYNVFHSMNSVVETNIKYVADGYIGREYIYNCFSQMLFADFFEGLCVGHSIRKCEMCGKYFVAVNSLEKRYCSKSCAAKAEAEGIKLKSRETSIANIYYRVTDNINHKKNRNKISEETCAKAKYIAKDKYIMAKTDSEYARGEYITEMDADKLIKEATENIDE